MADSPQTIEAIERLARKIADDQNLCGNGFRTDVYFFVEESHRDEARRQLGISKGTP